MGRKVDALSKECGELPKHVQTLEASVEALKPARRAEADAHARANASAGELTQTPEFQELQRVINKAAGLASDLEALARLQQLEPDRYAKRLI